MKNSNTEKRNDRFTVFLFLACIFCVLFACILMPDEVKSSSENRELEQLPEFSAGAVLDGSFMKSFESYTSDQVIARDMWVSLKNITDRSMGKKDNGSVYFGKNGYLFPIEKIDQNQLKLNLQYTKEFLRSMRAENPKLKASVLIAPTSAEILADKLPNHAVHPYQQSVMQAAEKALGSDFTDISDALKAHSEEYIYYRTDHHWTTLGAYYGYVEWALKTGRMPADSEAFQVETVSDDFYGTTYSKAVGAKTEADSIDKYSRIGERPSAVTVQRAKGEAEYDSLYDDDYLKEKDKYSYFLRGNNPLTTIHTQNKNGTTLLVVKDSYANCFIPFLTGEFETIYVVDLRFYKGDLLKTAKENQVDEVLLLYNAVQFSQDRNLVYLQGKER